jgi:hypothetical protein
MKLKPILVITLCLLLIVGFTSPARAEEPSSAVDLTAYAYILGDANEDSKVDTGDITKVKRIYFGVDTPTPGADANQDGKVDPGDITKIKRIYFGLEG